MSVLIQELTNEHKLIADRLNKAYQLGVTTDAGQRILLSAKNALLAHLKKEDEQLYKVLNLAAQKDQNLQETLSIFARDMDQISSEAMGFFEKYSNGGEGIQFAKDFGRFYARISRRIHKEENILYKKYSEVIEIEEKCLRVFN